MGVTPIKLMIANGARPGVTPEALVAHWRQVHAPLVIEHLAPQPYRLTTFSGRDGGLAAMASLYFEPDRAPAPQLPPAIAADPFYTMIGERIALRTTEHVLLDGPSDGHGVKMTTFVRRRAGVSAEAFFDHWLHRHGPAVAATLRTIPGGMRYAVSFAHDEPDDAPYHGVAELWYADAAAGRAHIAALGDDGFDTVADLSANRSLPGREIDLRPSAPRR